MRRALSVLAALAILGLGAPSFAAPEKERIIIRVPPEGEEQKPEEEHHEGHALKPINWFDFSNSEQPPWGAYAINFAILVGVYVYYGQGAIKKGLADRRANIKKEIDDAQKMLKEAEKRAERYQKKLQDIDADMEAAKKTLIDNGVAERERIIREAREKSARMERDADFLAQQELKQMREDLLRETMMDAIQGAEALLVRSVTQADHERLAEEYLKQLAAMAPGELEKRGVS